MSSNISGPLQKAALEGTTSSWGKFCSHANAADHDKFKKKLEAGLSNGTVKITGIVPKNRFLYLEDGEKFFSSSDFSFSTDEKAPEVHPDEEAPLANTDIAIDRGLLDLPDTDHQHVDQALDPHKSFLACSFTISDGAAAPIIWTTEIGKPLLTRGARGCLVPRFEVNNPSFAVGHKNRTLIALSHVYRKNDIVKTLFAAIGIFKDKGYTDKMKICIGGGSVDREFFENAGENEKLWPEKIENINNNREAIKELDFEEIDDRSGDKRSKWSVTESNIGVVKLLEKQGNVTRFFENGRFFENQS